MQYTKLGKTGVNVSRICLGTMGFGWLTDEKESKAIVDKALDLGINFFDTANIYARGRGEEILGSALGKRRDEAVIASKVFWSINRPTSAGLSRAFVLKELNDSLERLQTDYIDLYYIHRFDKHISLENMLRTLNYTIQQGKVAHLGASTMFAWELMKSLWVADRLGLESFEVLQPQYNLLYREEEREILRLCQDQNIAVVPWSPLAKGALSGKYANLASLPETGRMSEIAHWFLRPQDLPIIDRVIEIAKNRQLTPAQISLAWLLSKDPVTAPIVGVSKIQHLEEAAEAVEINLTVEEIIYLEELYQVRDLVGHYSGELMPGDEGYKPKVSSA